MPKKPCPVCGLELGKNLNRHIKLHDVPPLECGMYFEAGRVYPPRTRRYRNQNGMCRFTTRGYQQLMKHYALHHKMGPENSEAMGKAALVLSRRVIFPLMDER